MKRLLVALFLVVGLGGIAYVGLHFFGPPMVVHVVHLQGLTDTDHIGTGYFSPDGKLLATVFIDEVRLWDVKTGHFLKLIQSHQGDAHIAKFSPDGKKLLTISTEGLKLWDVQSGQLLAVLNPPLKEKAALEPLWGANFSPDGEYIAGLNWEFDINIWKVSTKELVETVAGALHQRYLTSRGAEFTHTFWSVVMSPDNKFVLQDDGAGHLYIWDRTMQKNHCMAQYALAKKYAYAPHPFSFSKDGKSFFIYAGGESSFLNWYDTETCQIKKTYEVEGEEIYSIVLLSDGHTFLLGFDKPELRAWDGHTGQVVMNTKPYRPDAKEPPFRMKVSQDGRSLLTLTEKGIVIWDFQGKRQLLH